MIHPIKIMKEEQKELAKEIREEHSQLLSRKFRHVHIAYCELRGRSREEIESKVRDGNNPDERWIERIKSTFLSNLDAFNKEQTQDDTNT